MPRPATTFFGLILVAVSIGFNMVRYPVVWELVGPAQASESIQPAGSAQPEEPERPSPASQEPPPPPQAVEGEPVPEIGKQVAVEETKPAVIEEPEARKPLVPVTPIVSSTGPEPASSAGIRRLPPVDPTASIAQGDKIASPDGAIPFYPTTGIE